MSYAIRNDKQGFRSVDSADDVLADEYFSVGMIEIKPAAPTIEELTESATVERDRLLSLAALRIAPLQYAADLGETTATEAKALDDWKRYSVAVNRITEQSGFPRKINWPDSP